MAYPGEPSTVFVLTANQAATPPLSESSFRKITVTGAGDIVVKGSNLHTFVTDAYVKANSDTEVTIAVFAGQTILGQFTSVKATTATGVCAYL